jgi:dimethylhistidine N-methyltransferase
VHGAGETSAVDVAEVLRGLLAPVRKLPPKLFYDARGAALFERICELPEYYLTRAEFEILERQVDQIAAHLGPRCALIEYGSGAGVKIRLLLDALDHPVAYVPIDISGEQLAAVTAELRAAYPAIEVLPIEADYTMPITLPTLPDAARRVAFFPGSTIGNFEPDAAMAFLRRIRHTVEDNGALILGVDRVKSAAVLEAAYDDAAGVTAEFNLNLLARLNRDLGADFDLSRFRHRATFNAAERRIEMHLVSVADQDVHIAGHTIAFKRGETIWTESSYKYDEPHLHQLAAASGFQVDQIWTDQRDRFWVALLNAE